MAHHKSAIKRIRSSAKRQARNKARKTALRTVVRAFHKTEGEGVAAAAKIVSSTADRFARKGLIHKNKASRLKARAQKKAAKAAKK